MEYDSIFNELCIILNFDFGKDWNLVKSMTSQESRKDILVVSDSVFREYFEYKLCSTSDIRDRTVLFNRALHSELKGYSSYYDALGMFDYVDVFIFETADATFCASTSDISINPRSLHNQESFITKVLKMMIDEQP